MPSQSLKVTLTGDAQITVGASYIEVLGLTGIVTIDTPLMETYKNYTSYNNHMTGDYPLLHTGRTLSAGRAVSHRSSSRPTGARSKKGGHT